MRFFYVVISGILFATIYLAIFVGMFYYDCQYGIQGLNSCDMRGF